MTLTATLWQWLTSRDGGERRRAPTHGLPDLRPLDIEQIARELDLAAQAQRLGAAGLPDAQAKALSGPEAAIVQRIEKARQDHVDWAVRRLGILERDIARQDVTLAVNRARAADQGFERAASGLLAEQEALLATLRDTALARHAELDAFARRHRLARGADYPSPAKRTLLYGVLLLMVAFEGVANSFFFAEGVSTGLVGGFVFAAAFAATNVALAFLLGKFALRQAAHVEPLRKVLGLAALPLALAAMTAIALATAHMRDALTSDAPDAAATALRTLLASPLQLAGIASWGLFVASLLFALVALVDGLKMDDPYPGYGRVTRRARQAQDDFDAEFDDLRDAVEALRAEHLAAFERDLRESQAAVRVLEDLIGDKRATSSRLANALLDADHALDALLRRFRTDNELQRGAAPRPVAFDELPPLAPLQMPDFRWDADDALLVHQRALVDALLAEVERLRANLQAAFNRQVDRATPLAAHLAPAHA